MLLDDTDYSGFHIDVHRFKKYYIRGFTLVEILISLAILAMIVASTFTIFRSASISWQKGEARSGRYHNARVAIGKMSEEISQAVIDENSPARFMGNKDEVQFISFISASSGIFELAEVGYRLDKEKRFLMRDEDAEPDYDFSTQDYNDILADNISQLEFSYYDGNNWSDSWDSDSSGGGEDPGALHALPEAVKIRIKIEDKKGREAETFEAVTRLKTA